MDKFIHAKPADEVAAAMNKQRKSSYKAPTGANVNGQQQLVDTETGGMIGELALICEQHVLELYIAYNASEEVWDCDIDDGKTRVFSSFIYKHSLTILLQNAYNATLEYIKKQNYVQLSLFD